MWICRSVLNTVIKKKEYIKISLNVYIVVLIALLQFVCIRSNCQINLIVPILQKKDLPYLPNHHLHLLVRSIYLTFITSFGFKQNTDFKMPNPLPKRCCGWDVGIFRIYLTVWQDTNWQSTTIEMKHGK